MKIVFVKCFWCCVVFSICFLCGFEINFVLIKIDGIFGDFNIVRFVVCGCFLCILVIFFNLLIIFCVILKFVFIEWFIDILSSVCVKYFLFVVFFNILVVLFKSLECFFLFLIYLFIFELVWCSESIYIEVLFGCGLVNVLVWIEIKKLVFFLWVMLVCVFKLIK